MASRSAASASAFSQVDEYGFERPASFDYAAHEVFMSHYIKVLAKRNKKWNDHLSSKGLRPTATLKRFIRKGVPTEHRRLLWLTTSGAERLRQADLYVRLLDNHQVHREHIVEAIKTDIPRTFPDNLYFSKGLDYPFMLYNILVAYAHHNPEVGYCQGLNYIVGLLLLATKNEEDSFWLLKALIETILPKYYIKTMSGLIIDIKVLEKLVQNKEPDIYNHFKAVNLPWAVVVTKWFVCLYAEVLPTETVYRIWDCLFHEGSKILFRVALTLLKKNKAKILECTDLPTTIDCLKQVVKSAYVVNCHEFMNDIFSVPGSLPQKTIDKLRAQFSELEQYQ